MIAEQCLIVACLKWPTEIASSWLDIVVWILGLIPVCCGVFQIWRNNEIKRAELLRDLLNQYYDNSITESIKSIDEEKIVFTRGEFSVPQAAQRSMALAEPALLYFSNLCYLKKAGLLSEKEFSFFEWRIRKIMSNLSVCDYVRSLAERHEKVAIDSLLEYCSKED